MVSTIAHPQRSRTTDTGWMTVRGNPQRVSPITSSRRRQPPIGVSLRGRGTSSADPDAVGAVDLDHFLVADEVEVLSSPWFSSLRPSYADHFDEVVTVEDVLPCQFETICERCGFYDTGPQFVEIIRRQQADAIDHADHDRASVFTGLLDDIDKTG